MQYGLENGAVSCNSADGRSVSGVSDIYRRRYFQGTVKKVKVRKAGGIFSRPKIKQNFSFVELTCLLISTEGQGPEVTPPACLSVRADRSTARGHPHGSGRRSR